MGTPGSYVICVSGYHLEVGRNFKSGCGGALMHRE